MASEIKTESIPKELLYSVKDILSSLKDLKQDDLDALKTKAGKVLDELRPYINDEELQLHVTEQILRLKGEATECFKRKDFNKALSYIDQSIHLQPLEATHYSNRSLANLRLGNINNAIDDARQSIRCDPSWGKGYFRLATALSEKGDIEEAINYLNQSLETNLTDNEKKTVIKELDKLIKPKTLETDKENTIWIEGQNKDSHNEDKLEKCHYSWFNNSNKFPLEIVTNSVGNRRFIATRDINENELLWRESPLASIVQSQYEDKICHFCYNSTKQLNYKCSKCECAYWCSMECQKNHLQKHAYECRIYVKTKGITKNSQALRLIMQLMFISMSNPGNRKIINDLQSCDSTKETQNSKNMKHMLTAVEKIGQFGDLSKREIMHIIGCINVNSFVVTDLDGRRLGNALFSGSSFFNHDCNPNAIIGFDFGTSSNVSGLQLTAKSVSKLKKGDEVNISYIELFRSTFIRQRELFDSKSFKCNCLTCKQFISVDRKFENLDQGLEMIFKQADKSVENAMTMVLDRKVFDNALISIVKAFKLCNGTEYSIVDAVVVEGRRWVMFELHTLVTSLILKWPKEVISKSLAKALIQSSEIHPNSLVDQKLLLDGSHDHLQVLLFHATQSLAFGLEHYNAYHPRVALCRRSMGNALMLLAGTKQDKERLVFSKRASQEYKSGGDIVKVCWDEKHPDCVSIRTLENWAKSFT